MTGGQEHNKRKWYGWVPVLGHELISPLLLKNPTLEEDRGWQKYQAPEEGVGTPLQDYIKNLPPTDDWYFRGHQQDDTDRFDGYWIISVNKGQKDEYGEDDKAKFPVPKRAIILQDSCTEDDTISLELFAEAEIEEFSKNGTYGFRLIHKALAVGTDEYLAIQINVLVKDFYHQHIYTHNDVGIPPVLATSKEDGICKIWLNHYASSIGVSGKRLCLSAADEVFDTNAIKYLSIIIKNHSLNAYYDVRKWLRGKKTYLAFCYVGQKIKAYLKALEWLRTIMCYWGDFCEQLLKITALRKTCEWIYDQLNDYLGWLRDDKNAKTLFPPSHTALKEIDRCIGECKYGYALASIAFLDAEEGPDEYLAAMARIESVLLHLRQRLSSGFNFYTGELAGFGVLLTLGTIIISLLVCLIKACFFSGKT